jgi:glycosyltransferase involved in cell wall biosynthesis
VRSKKLVSIVVPVLNEEMNIELCYDALVRVLYRVADRYDWELIFTDNHSADRTFELAAQLADKDSRVRAYRFSRNFGFQRSILTGYLQARGDAIIQIDCDLQDPPELILQFLEKWEQNYQVVYGIRRTRKESLWLRSLRAAFYYLVDLLSEYPLPRQAGDFRLVGRPLIEELKKMDESSPYLRGTIAGMGFNQIGIPYDREERKHGHSKFRLGSLIGLGLDGILNTSIMPLRLATYTGICISVLTMLGGAYYLVAAVLYGRERWPSGFASLAIFILTSLGLNALFLGILGEYLGRIYKQIKKGPLTIIEQAIDSQAYTPPLSSRASAAD